MSGKVSSLKDLLHALSKKELIDIARAIGVGVVEDRDAMIETLYTTLHLRSKIYTSTGMKIQVRIRPRYHDSWSYCTRCDMAFRVVDPFGKILTKCPVCRGSIRHKSHKRLKA